MRRPVQRGLRLRGLKPSGHWPSGNVRYYYRYTTPPTPMPDAAKDSPEFLTAYAAAAKGEPLLSARPAHKTGTIGAAIRAFLASDSFMTRAASTRERWRSFAEESERFFAAAKIEDLQSRHIRKFLARFDPHPANNRLKLWRAMGRWWMDAGLIENDPARDVRPRATPKTDGFTAWTQDDAATFRAHWPIGTPERLTFEMIHQTGAAIGDAMLLGPANMIGGGWMTYTRQKCGTLCTIPLFAPAPDWYPSSADLRACLDAAPKHMTWITTRSGKSRSLNSASQWFSAAARSAGIERGKTAHGVRKLLSVIMAEAGASEAQRMAILGHESNDQTRHYSKTADARRIISGTDFDNSGEPVVKSSDFSNDFKGRLV